MKRLILGIFLVVWWCGNLVCAQDIAVKTNLLYWATSTPNIGFEFGLGKRTTLDLVGGYNPWTLNKDDNKKIKHWMVMPEFRYWLCERFNGHFFGIHTGFAEYNISGVRIPFQNKSTQEHRYEGWATGIGISYGYTWILGKRISVPDTFTRSTTSTSARLAVVSRVTRRSIISARRKREYLLSTLLSNTGKR